MLWTELCSTHNAYAEDLTSSRDGIWKWGPWVIIRFRLGHEGGVLLEELVPL